MIEEGNKLIAEFMGLTTESFSMMPRESEMDKRTADERTFVLCYSPDKSKLFKENEQLYHTSWDWLMPVVEKIESFGFQFFIHNEGSYMRKWHYKSSFPDFGNVGETKIEATHKTVIQFIQWYNSLKTEAGK